MDISHAVSEPVKIHKSQANRTWRNSSDLESISLGQDLLLLELNDPDLQIQDLIDKKPWKDNSGKDNQFKATVIHISLYVLINFQIL